MSFIPTSTNMVAVLVSSLAFIGIWMLLRKRYDSNVPLIFYFFALPFTFIAQRPVHPGILYGGLGFALMLRFEFMGSGFTRFISLLAAGALGVMSWELLHIVFR